MTEPKSIEEVLRDESASAADVIRTLRELRADLQRNPDGWENGTLERYLEAMEAWVTAVGPRVGDPSWRFVALMLEAGKIYE